MHLIGNGLNVLIRNAATYRIFDNQRPYREFTSNKYHLGAKNLISAVIVIVARLFNMPTCSYPYMYKKINKPTIDIFLDKDFYLDPLNIDNIRPVCSEEK